nr:branched-chain amino acid ABC transporter substrate-binding protein [Nocardia tenerifensis]
MQIDAEGREVARPNEAVSPAGDGKATCAPITIASTAPFTGKDPTGSRGLLGGVKLAVDQFNAANSECQVTVREFDTGGFPQTSADVARQIVSDPSIVALVGPSSSEIQLTGGTFSDAGLPVLFPGYIPVEASRGWRGFFRGMATTDVYRRALGKYLIDTAHFRKICVIRDDSGFGKGMAHDLVATLGPAADAGCRADVKQGDRDFGAAVSKVAAAKPDAVLYSGYAAEAAALVQQLKQGGVTAAFVTTEGALSTDFPVQARDSALGAIIPCTCAPVTGKFYFDFRTLNTQGAGWNGVEAYDLATIALSGIAAGHRTRADLIDYLRGYEGTGMGRVYRWSATGELMTPGIWIYTIG